MQIMELVTYLQNKNGTTEEYPFGPDVMVFKVAGKIFALVAWRQSPLTINLKCHPDQAGTLRNIFTAVKPGYHMNKDHWNTVIFDNSIPKELVFRMIDESYELIVQRLPVKKRKTLITK